MTDSERDVRAPFERWWVAAAVVLVLAVVAIVATSSGEEDDQGTSATPYAATQPQRDRDRPAVTSCRTVIYYVEGTARSATVTIENDTGGTDQRDNLTVPVASEKTGIHGINAGCFDPGDFVYVSAQNEDDTGDISCRIEADGIVVASSSSSASYGIASCDGNVPD